MRTVKDERTHGEKMQDWLFGTTWSGMFAYALIRATLFSLGYAAGALIVFYLFREA